MVKKFCFISFLLALIICPEIHSQPCYNRSFSINNFSQTENSSKSLFPLSALEIFGLFLTIVVAGLANSGGIGGGTLLTSILIIFFYYTENQALSIVYSLVFGGSLGNFFNIAGRRNPQTGKPLIDFDLALVCMPLMVMGTTFGVVLGRMVAPIVIIVGIIVVTAYSTIKVYKKAKRQYAEESNANRQPIVDNEYYRNLNNLHPSEIEGEDQSNEAYTSDIKLQEALKKEYKLFPKRKYGLLTGLLLIVMFMSLLKGTDKFPSFIGITYCGIGYWTIFLLSLVFCLVIFFVDQRFLRRNIKEIRFYHTQISKRGFEFNRTTVKRLSTLSTVAGVLAGLLGIGGGMIMNPTLLNIGIPPQEVAATSGFFVVQTSFISLFQSILYKDVPLLEEGFFFLVSLIGSFIVSFLLTFLVKKTKRPSLVLFALISVLILSIIVTPIFEIWQNSSNLKKLFEFNSICS